MSDLKKKLKLKTGLKKKIEQESNGGKDLRILPYYDLKDGEKMNILFVPDENGDLWTKYKVHGPNLGVKGVGGVRCSDEARQNECPACQRGYALLNEGKEDGNDYEAYKEEAKRWFAREYVLAQCLVLESPFEVPESPDGNQVKLMYLPYAVKNLIEESVLEGLIEEEDICTTPFVLKNKKNGNNNGYKTSYFARKQVEDEDLEYFEDLKVEPYDFTDLDIVPDETTETEVEEWLEKATHKVYDDDEEEEKKEGRPRTRTKPSRPSRKEEDDDHQQHEEEEEHNDDDDDSSKPSGAGSLRDRLNKLKR